MGKVFVAVFPQSSLGVDQHVAEEFVVGICLIVAHGGQPVCLCIGPEKSGAGGSHKHPAVGQLTDIAYACAFKDGALQADETVGGIVITLQTGVCAYPQVSLSVMKHFIDDIEHQGGGVAGIVLIHRELVTVETVQPTFRANPDISGLVLTDAGYIGIRQSVAGKEQPALRPCAKAAP